jgi:EF hand domain-containing protein
MMLIPALTLLLAAVEPPDTRPVFVTGHAWAPFISPMGEPFRARSANDDTLADWFARADRNHDGSITLDEMQADAERFFASLDTDHDGKLDPDEIANYEYEIAPDIQVMSRTRLAPGVAPAKPRAAETATDRPRRKRDRGDDIEDSALALRGGLQGAARYGLLNMPEPVAAADSDFDRAVTLAEFRRAALDRFALLDRTRSARLTLAELAALRPVIGANGRAKRPKDAPDTRVGNPLPPEPTKLD